jgi:hypothetical protein
MFTTEELSSHALMIELPWFIEKMEINQPEENRAGRSKI